MTTLILSPIIAVTLTTVASPVATRTSAPHEALPVAHIEGKIANPPVLELREPQSDQASPTAAPAAPPAPALKATAKPAPPPAPRPRRPAAPAVPVAAPPAAASPTSIIGIIEAAAARWGVSGTWMVSIARCESGLRPTAVNPSGPYLGLFQFLMSTFRANGGTNIWDPSDQANIAAKMLAHGQAHQWSCA